GVAARDPKDGHPRTGPSFRLHRSRPGTLDDGVLIFDPIGRYHSSSTEVDAGAARPFGTSITTRSPSPSLDGCPSSAFLPAWGAGVLIKVALHLLSRGYRWP